MLKDFHIDLLYEKVTFGIPKKVLWSAQIENKFAYSKPVPLCNAVIAASVDGIKEDSTKNC